MVAKQVFVPLALAQVLGAPALVLVWVLGLALGYSASAQELPALERQVELERIEDPESSVTVVFEGFVNEPDGAPAEGAVVVSSAGGRAVTDSSGSFRLEARVPLEAESIQITAVAGAGTNLLASSRVALPPSKSMRVSPLLLAQGGTCSLSWLPEFGGAPGVNGGVSAFTVFDDGSGPVLYAGGDFTAVGGIAANCIAKWDGSSWSALGTGMDDQVDALVVFDDGSGPALYAGGYFTTAGGVTANHVAKWDGSSWSALGSGMSGSLSNVYAFAVFDDGSGPALYAGGAFTTAGGVAASRIAKWNGSSWSALGSGVAGSVFDLAVFDDGSGPALYAGGGFTTAGGAAANRIAKWNGSSWSALGSGMNAVVRALTVFDDGSGPALYAGGDFTTAGGVAANRIGKWDGANWSNLKSGLSSLVFALTVFDDGSGPALYAGGAFTAAGGAGAGFIAKWNGSSWSALVGGGMDDDVLVLTVFDHGSGPALYAGGNFTAAPTGGIVASHIAHWDGSSWSALGSGMDDDVLALTVFDDGDGPALYAGGYFTTAGGGPANLIAKWDGSSWSALGAGLNGSSFPPLFPSVSALMVFDDGSSPALYAGGHFTVAGGVFADYIAKWDGSSWSALGAGMNGDVLALTVFDDGSGPALYAGGIFATAGGVAASCIAKWDGSSWSAPGSGVNSGVLALTVFDDGTGPALYAAGDFTAAGGVAASHIAKWDGSSWSALGSGTNNRVRALAVFDDGSGPVLYAGGDFTAAGGATASKVAKWDGSSWSPLGTEMNDAIEALVVFDDGTGPALYAGGKFTIAAGMAADYIAKWDGSNWSPLGSGMSSDVYALTAFHEGSGPALCAGGRFEVSPAGDSYLAKWGCELPLPTNYCTAGTSASGCQALLSATGTPSATAASGFSLLAATVEGQKDGLFFFGTNGQQANPWGNSTSYQCVVPPVVRTSLLTGTGTAGMCDGAFSLDMNTVWTNQPAKNPGAGAVVQAQLWYRDPFNTANNQKTSLSDAIEFVVAP